jgi:hypothetical protein
MRSRLCACLSLPFVKQHAGCLAASSASSQLAWVRDMPHAMMLQVRMPATLGVLTCCSFRLRAVQLLLSICQQILLLQGSLAQAHAGFF